MPNPDGSLTPLEQATRNAGFSTDFGEGRAIAFREAQGYTNQLDANGNLIRKQIPVTEQVANTVNNPILPVGAELVPVTQQVQSNELVTAPQLNPTATNIQPTAPVENVPQVQAQQVDPNNIAQVNQQDVLGGVQENTVQGTYTSPVETLNTRAFNLSDDSLVSNRLAAMFADIESGEVPPWAKAAHNTAMEVMGARGLSASSISAGAVALATMQSALPIAAHDADFYFQKDLSQFNADVQTDLVNFQTRQQNMLTDVSIANATEQFNASSKSQTQQFVSGMIKDIQQYNSNLTTNIETFNATQKQQADALNAGNYIQVQEFNKQLEQQTKEFNSNIQNQREQFNANMRFAIDQSNALWRRTLNTANTAAVNAANQANVQNKYNMSQIALNNIWQQYRDEVAWAFESAENQKDRDYNMAVISGNREYITDMETGKAVGALGTKIIDNLGSITSALDFNGNGSIWS